MIPKLKNRWRIEVRPDGTLWDTRGRRLTVEHMRKRMVALLGIANNLGVWAVLNLMRAEVPNCATPHGCALYEPRLGLAAHFMEEYADLLHEYHPQSPTDSPMQDTPENYKFFRADMGREWIWYGEEE